MVITCSRVWINRVRLPILLVVSWAGKMNIPLSPYVPENLVSRDGFSRPVPRQPAHLHTQAESGAYSWDSSRFPRRRPFIYLNRHTPMGQSRVYRVTQLRTDGVHCRESAGTVPVVLKVVPVTGAAILQVAMDYDQFMCASLFWKMSGRKRDGTTEPVSRDQILRRGRRQGNSILPLELTTSWIGNHTRLVPNLLHVMTTHTHKRTDAHYRRVKTRRSVSPGEQELGYLAAHLNFSKIWRKCNSVNINTGRTCRASSAV